MKAILLSVKPEWVAKILNGEKTLEIRKTMPKCELPIDVYIFCTKSEERLIYLPWKFDVQKNDDEYITDCDFTKGNGKVIAKFTLRKINEYRCSVYVPEKGLVLPHKIELQSESDYRSSIAKAQNWGWEKPKLKEILDSSCLSEKELALYLTNESNIFCEFFAWYISGLVIFDKPKKLREFEKVGSYNNPTIKCKGKERGRCNHGISPFTGKLVGCVKARLTKAPQSWCYVEN